MPAGPLDFQADRAVPGFQASPDQAAPDFLDRAGQVGPDYQVQAAPDYLAPADRADLAFPAEFKGIGVARAAPAVRVFPARAEICSRVAAECLAIGADQVAPADQGCLAPVDRVGPDSQAFLVEGVEQPVSSAGQAPADRECLADRTPAPQTTTNSARTIT